MNDYEILLVLNRLEVERHEKVVHILDGIGGLKAPLLGEVHAEIAARKRLIADLKARTEGLRAGVSRRRRGARGYGLTVAMWAKNG